MKRLAQVDWPKLGSQVVDVGTFVVLGGVGFVGSARHVLHLADTHGQKGIAAWLIAGSVEVLAAFCGLEVKRRGNSKLRLVPIGVLVLACAFIISANLAAAERSTWGYILAVVPAVVFLAVVGVAETRPGRSVRRQPRRQPTVQPTQEAPAAKPQPIAQESDSHAEERILAVLSRGELAVGQVMAELSMPRGTAKSALGRLKDAGKVRQIGQGPGTVYRVNLRGVEAV